MKALVKTNEERKRKEQERARMKQRDKYYVLKYGVKYGEYTGYVDESERPNERRNNKGKGNVIDKEKWVVNVSKRELTDIEKRVLQKGAGFAITNKRIDHDEYVTAAQQASEKLPQCYSLALKAEVTELLRQAKPAESNLTKGEMRAINNLKKDSTIVIMAADKGKALVVMDRDEYVQKMEEKFSDTSTYIKIQKDPTQEIRQEIIDQLIYLENSGSIDKKTNLQLHPNRAQTPRAYGSPKIRKGIL